MSPHAHLALIIFIGLVLAYMSGEAVTRGKHALAAMLGWLALAFLWGFIRFPMP